MSSFGVILIRIFPHSDWIRTRITANTDTSRSTYPRQGKECVLYDCSLTGSALTLAVYHFSRKHFGHLPPFWVSDDIHDIFRGHRSSWNSGFFVIYLVWMIKWCDIISILYVLTSYIFSRFHLISLMMTP